MFYKLFTSGGISIVIFWLTAIVVVLVLCVMGLFEDIERSLYAAKKR